MKTYSKKINEYALKKIKSEINAAQILSSKDAADYARQFYFDDLEIYESMFLILMNRKNNVEGYVKISQGGTAGTVCDVKLIANYAVQSLANSVILVHNHPSGTIAPSDADKFITKKVLNALDLFDIKLLDHVIIVPGDNYYSFADNEEI
jgi:DNA repair protein RadC